MTQSILSFWVTALPLVLSPGPANLSLASLGVAFGFRRSLPYLGGILLGTFAVVLSVAFGISALILSQPFIVQAFKIAAVGYIVYLAWRIAIAPICVRSETSANTPSMLAGLGAAMANPKAFAALGAVYTGHGMFGDDVVFDAALKIAILSAVVVFFGTAWLAFGAVFSNLLSHPNLGRLVNLSFALLLVISVIPAVLT